MNNKLTPLLILIIFILGAWFMIDKMSHAVKITQPTEKTQPK